MRVETASRTGLLFVVLAVLGVGAAVRGLGPQVVVADVAAPTPGLESQGGPTTTLGPFQMVTPTTLVAVTTMVPPTFPLPTTSAPSPAGTTTTETTNTNADTSPDPGSPDTGSPDAGGDTGFVPTTFPVFVVETQPLVPATTIVAPDQPYDNPICEMARVLAVARQQLVSVGGADNLGAVRAEVADGAVVAADAVAGLPEAVLGGGAGILVDRLDQLRVDARRAGSAASLDAAIKDFMTPVAADAVAVYSLAGGQIQASCPEVLAALVG